MSETTDARGPDAAEIRAGRRELVVSAILFAAACAVLFFASRASFRWIMNFPLVFAVVVSVLSVWSLRTAPRIAWQPRVLLTLATICVAAFAPSVHEQAFDDLQRSREMQAMDRLGGQPAPEVPFVGAIGMEQQQGSLALDGRPTLLNFWATWCGPCVAELPVLQTYASEYRAAGLRVIGVTKLYDGADSADAEIAGLGRFLEEHGVTYPVVVGGDESPAHAAYGVVSLPTSVLVDAEGRVVDYGVGIEGTVRLLKRAVELVRG